MIRAGDLDRLVTIEQPTETRNAIGEKAQTWSSFATWWTQKQRAGGSETLAAGQRFGSAVDLWKGRYISGVTTKMRINDGGVTYDIVEVDDSGRRTEGGMFLTTRQRSA